MPEPDGDGQSPSSDQSVEPSPQPSRNETEDTEVAGWVTGALERLRHGAKGSPQKPALHAVALDAVGENSHLNRPTDSPAA